MFRFDNSQTDLFQSSFAIFFVLLHFVSANVLNYFHHWLLIVIAHKGFRQTLDSEIPTVCMEFGGAHSLAVSMVYCAELLS